MTERIGGGHMSVISAAPAGREPAESMRAPMATRREILERRVMAGGRSPVRRCSASLSHAPDGAATWSLLCCAPVVLRRGPRRPRGHRSMLTRRALSLGIGAGVLAGPARAQAAY